MKPKPANPYDSVPTICLIGATERHQLLAIRDSIAPNLLDEYAVLIATPVTFEHSRWTRLPKRLNNLFHSHKAIEGTRRLGHAFHFRSDDPGTLAECLSFLATRARHARCTLDAITLDTPWWPNPAVVAAFRKRNPTIELNLKIGPIMFKDAMHSVHNVAMSMLAYGDSIRTFVLKPSDSYVSDSDFGYDRVDELMNDPSTDGFDYAIAGHAGPNSMDAIKYYRNRYPGLGFFVHSELLDPQTGVFLPEVAATLATNIISL